VARIAVVAGDGIGPEVVAQARKVIDAVVPKVQATEYDLGAVRYHRTGEVLPPSCWVRSVTRASRPACWSGACC